MRKLTTIRYISDIEPIKKADLIELATIDGWKVVVKKNEFSVGDTCLYFEIDSWLPADNENFAFLIKSGVKKDPSGFERIRIRTIKLRGQISQGLALPLDNFNLSSNSFELDFSEELNVIKYERPEPLTADAAGTFPLCVPKTDEERIQNIFKELKEEYKNHSFMPTLKLDGTSCSLISISPDYTDDFNIKPEAVINTNNGYDMAVCSRTLQLKYNKDSHMFKAIEKENLAEKLSLINAKMETHYAMQGEVVGPGIQGNKEKLNTFIFFAFNLYDVDNKCYESYETSLELFKEFDINFVPNIEEPFNVFEHFEKIEDLLAYADGKSLNADVREGVVFKSLHIPGLSFKVISNKFLLNGGDE